MSIKKGLYFLLFNVSKVGVRMVLSLFFINVIWETYKIKQTEFTFKHFREILSKFYLNKIIILKGIEKARSLNRSDLRPRGQSFPAEFMYIPNQSSSSSGINAEAMIMFVFGHHRIHWHSTEAANCNRKLDCNSIIFGVKAKQINKTRGGHPGYPIQG